MKSRVELSQRENMHSHDSAIDAGEWEESKSQDGCVKVRNLVRVLPRQRDVTIEIAPVVKFSNCHALLKGDRILAINEVPVTGQSGYQVIVTF